MSLSGVRCLLACALALPLGGAGAQLPGVAGLNADSLPLLGSDAEDRERQAQLRGRGGGAGWTIRALSSRLPVPAGGDSLRWMVLAPELFVVENSELPFSHNDGLLWAGRGRSWRVRGGLAASFGPVRAIVLPEVARAANDSFADVDQVRWYRPPVDRDRYSEFASPWNMHPVSADVPVRFGRRRFSEASLGQSSVWYAGGAVDAGVSTENLWWGPGIHDALVMTNHAAGVPHVFVRTGRPVRTPVGDFEGRLIVGRLAESDHFDLDETNDDRSLSAAVVTYAPRWQRTLTLGIARAVYAPVSSGGAVFGHALDVFGAFDRPGARPVEDTAFTRGRDQLTSLFARWIFPRVGWEFYGEAGRGQRPSSLRDFLVDPGHTRAYVVGTHVVRPVGGAAVRVQLEVAQMEQSTSYRYRPTPSWYTSRATPQGYTQRGQVIGAGIGPGSSHQWLAADWVAPAWSAGAFFGRWRFNTDGMYNIITFPLGTGWCEFDTTIYPGVRGSLRHRLVGLVQVEAIFGNRMNAFHQNNSGCPAPDVARNVRDVRNRTIRLTIAPRVFR